jgi:GntR family transcriptional regulator, transcriptional repressor for pyruvate dehydrogenase complex
MAERPDRWESPPVKPDREFVQFDRIEQLRAHQYVAEQIRRQIMLRLVQTGQALPSVRDLAPMFRVGRATVQRAIDVLEAEGLVERRRGRTGGTFVVGPVRNPIGMRRLVNNLREQRDVVEEALDFRLEVEPAAAARASLSRSLRDLGGIGEAEQRLVAAKTDAEFLRFDTEFHMALAGATHNRLLIEAIERVRLILNDPLTALPESELWHERTYREHQAIVDAVERGDAAAARRAMLVHVQHTDGSIRVLLAAL